MADALQIYKVRPGALPPSTVNDLREDMVVEISAAEAEADVRTVLPDFVWPAGAREVAHHGRDFELELRLQSHGLFAQFRGERGLEVLKQLAASRSWLIVNPVSLQFVR